VWVDDEELRFHLEMRVRDYLAQGYTREQAERAARERLGDLGEVQRELRSHEQRRERMSRVWQEARIALRGFRRSPTFTASVVLILGVGIGMAVAMWTVFHAVLLRPLPVNDAQRVVFPQVLDQASVDIAFLPPDVDRMRRDSRTMSAVAGYAHGGPLQWPMMDGDHMLPLMGSQVQWQFFQVLDAKPVLGRLLGPTDDSLSRVMVLSYDAWQRHFGGDPRVVGRHFVQTQLQVTYTIVGVAPPGIDFPAGSDYWMTLPWLQSLDVVARLAPNATSAMARTEFRSLSEQILREVHPNGSGDLANSATLTIGGDAIRTFDAAVVGDVHPVLLLLVSAVGLLLALVCINVGNLLMLRTAARARELAVRRALGATYADTVRQLVIENTLLAAAGGVLGLVVGETARRALIWAAPAELPRLDALRVSGAPVGAAVLVAFLSLLLFGVAPAFVAVRRNPVSPLKLDTRGGTSTRQRRRVRQMLVGSQVALALVLLAGAGLLSRSLERLQSLDLGFRTDHLSVLTATVPFAKYPDSPFGLWDKIAPRIRALPGVTGLSPTIIPPLMGPNFWTSVWQTEGETPDEVARNPMTPIDAVGSEYFQTLGVPILRGRAFTGTDDERGQPVAIVSAAIARRYWPGQDPIGKRIQSAADVAKQWRTVVGVVSDTHWRSLRQATPMVYVPYRQYIWQGGFALRSATSLKALLPAIRGAIREGDPDASIWMANTMDDYMAKPLAQPRMSALLLSTFGLVALALAAIGLYGIMASAVREQTRDIGVRMALGATPSRVRGEVLGRALVISLVGAGVGLACALAASRVIASLLFQVSPTDPIALGGACAVLLSVAAVAAYLPAYHASRVDPARALQGD
jgi:putative ABC transport system permease protein